MGAPAGQAMVDMIVNEGPLCLDYRALYRVQLCRQIDAGPPFFDHRDHTPQMPFGAFQPGGNGGVACMALRF